MSSTNNSRTTLALASYIDITSKSDGDGKPERYTASVVIVPHAVGMFSSEMAARSSLNGLLERALNVNRDAMDAIANAALAAAPDGPADAASLPPPGWWDESGDPGGMGVPRVAMTLATLASTGTVIESAHAQGAPVIAPAVVPVVVDGGAAPVAPTMPPTSGDGIAQPGGGAR